MKYFFVGLFLIFGCAKPNYQSPSTWTAVGTESKGYKLFFATQNTAVDLNFEVGPNDSEANSFTLKFYKPENPDVPVDIDQTLAVVLWMPSMGHGSSPVHIQKVATGIYKITDAYFIMPGEWEIRLQLKENSSVIEQVVQKISI